jgi:sulfite exporter TauE/SafE
MCGSIVGILTAQLPEDGARWPFHLAYNCGRIASYTLAGLLVGAIGQAGMLLRDVVPVQHLLFALSSLMLIALGLYLAGIWSMVRRIEQAGSMLWQRIQPLTRSLFPITSPSASLVARHVMGLVAAVRAGIQRAGHGIGQRSCAKRRVDHAGIRLGYLAQSADH